MLSLSTRSQTAIGIALVILLITTRSHHFATLSQILPSASWSVFFLAGVYLRPAWVLALLLGLAAFLDYAAITVDGVSNFCISPAYIALLPAYSLLWVAGRWYAGRHRFHPRALLTLSVTIIVAAAVCELITSGSFYYYSGRFTHPTVAAFAGRFVTYFPASLWAMMFWTGTAALVHVVAATQPPHYDGTSPT